MLLFGMAIAFERQGSGPALVLIHGLGHRRQGWNAVLDRLTPHREVITLDLPGHGESSALRLSGDNPVAEVAEQIAELFGELGLSKPHVAGNSLGGVLALALGATGNAASVTALSPAGFPGHRYEMPYAHAVFAVARMGAQMMEPVVKSMAGSTAGRAVLYGQMVSRPSQVPAEQVPGDVAGFARAGAAMHAFFTGPQDFDEPVPVPVTIAWGSRDRILPPSNAVIARRRLPDARFIKLTGCGHVPMTDDPAAVARILLEGSSDRL
jgi:pimeloyl-ACP methyl ester carboxylesterase